MIPYILWNIIYAFFMIGLSKAGLIKNITIGKNVWNILFQILNAEFSPLWFVKYLMLFVIVSPIVYYVIRNKFSGLILLICCIGMNFIFYYNGIMQIPLNVNANNFVMFNYQWIYYLIGGYAALNLKSLVEAGNKKKVYIGLVVILLLISSYILIDEYYGAAEPPVRCGESHLSGLTEPPHFIY